MAMDVDHIYLAPTQQAEHIWNNQCFICHKVECSTRNHPGARKSNPTKTYLPRNQHPHNVRNTNTSPIPKPPRTQPIDEIESYLNVMRTNRNLSNQEVLKSLQIIFDDSLDEQGEQVNTICLEQPSTRKDF